MSTNSEWVDRVADLERRVGLLEGSRRPDESSPPDTAAAEAPADSGSVSYSGEVTLNGRVVWNIALDAHRILDLPDASGAAVLASLGHPARVALVRRLLTGPATVADLRQASGGASTGQLYHHLRTLSAGGVVEQDGRGRYRVPATAVVPVLTMLLAAADVAGDLR